ncbi:MAG: hypothetical protein IT443_05805 [Phycisphaeraceae bacterium]|nr:hypothetical protein [Phycisphaeraceae bacterium]
MANLDQATPHDSPPGILWRSMFWDVLLPWSVALWLTWQVKLNADDQEAFEIFVIPLILCLVRAGIGGRPVRLRLPDRKRRLQLVLYQILFAMALFVLMFFEVVIGAIHHHQRLRGDLIAWAVALGLYAVYLSLVLLSESSYRRATIGDVPLRACAPSDP